MLEAVSPIGGRHPRSHPRERTRIYVVAVALIFGQLLVASVYSSYRRARELAETLTRGEAETHFHAFHRIAPPEARDQRRLQLTSVLEAQHDAGLRYIAVLDRNGDPESSAGEALGPAGAVELAGAGPETRERVGDRVRVTSVMQRSGQRPPGPAAFQGGSPPGTPNGEHPFATQTSPGAMGPPPGAMGPPPGALGPPPGPNGAPPPPPRVLIEFVPMAAPALIERARMNLGLAALGDLLLLVAAFAFWRMSGRAAEREAAMFHQQRLASLGEMSAVMAHEIRNPLASLKGHAQLLRESTEPGGRTHAKASLIVDEALRLESLTRGLLDFARNRAPDFESVSPKGCVEAALATLGNPSVEVDDAEAPALWVLESERVEGALRNLIENAIAASEGPEQVRVRISRGPGARGALRYEVFDRGPGVPEAQRDQIFEPFHTTKSRGTGLGLAIVRQVAKIHGGEVWVQGRDGGGSRFILEIPPGRPSPSTSERS